MHTGFDAGERFKIAPTEHLLPADSRPHPGQFRDLHTLPAPRSLALAAKRLLDFAAGILGLLILAPLFALISLAVKLQDGGPVIHRRRVVGRKGEFDALKFRTMRPDADRWLRENPVLGRNFSRISSSRTTLASLPWAGGCAKPASMNCPNCGMLCAAK